MISHHILIHGHFSENDNFIAIDHNGKTFHVYKEQMELLNLKSIDDIIFPLFAIGKIKTFDQLTGQVGDSDRKIIVDVNGKNLKFNRLTAMAVFEKFENLVDAYAQSSALNLGFNSEVVAENTLKAQDAFKEYYNYRVYNFEPEKNNDV